MNIQSSRGSLLIADVIPPRSRQVLAVLSTIDNSAEYEAGHSYWVILFLYYMYAVASMCTFLQLRTRKSASLLPDWCEEANLSEPNLQHIPALDTTSFDPIHSTVSVD